jgi:serine protease Do
MLQSLSIALCLLAQAPSSDPPSPADLVASLESVFTHVVEKAEPSVVAITRLKGERGDGTLAVRGRDSSRELLQFKEVPVGGSLERGQTSPDFTVTDFGSGIVIGDKGEILTTFHVVKGAKWLVVRASGQQFEAEIIAADPRSDLAVIVPREGPTLLRPKLTPIALGDATKLKKGSFLIALGNPFNAGRDGRASASLGILSNTSRRIDDTGVRADEKQLRHYPTLLQLDAKLNLGMSGGAVVNMKGELVGITTNAANVSAFDAQAGYAIPFDALGRRIVDALREGKEVGYGFLGIGLFEENPTNRVSRIQRDSPAGEAGLITGDQIISVNGIRVDDGEELVATVNSFAPGRPILLKVVRNGLTIDKRLVLSKYPPKIGSEVIATNRPEPWRGLRVDYLSQLPGGSILVENNFNDNGTPSTGVAVTEIIPGSPADVAGLRPGQKIISVNGKPVRSPADFAKAVADVEGPVEVATDTEPKVTIR